MASVFVAIAFASALMVPFAPDVVVVSVVEVVEDDPAAPAEVEGDDSGPGAGLALVPVDTPFCVACGCPGALLGGVPPVVVFFALPVVSLELPVPDVPDVLMGDFELSLEAAGDGLVLVPVDTPFCVLCGCPGALLGSVALEGLEDVEELEPVPMEDAEPEAEPLASVFGAGLTLVPVDVPFSVACG